MVLIAALGADCPSVEGRGNCHGSDRERGEGETIVTAETSGRNVFISETESRHSPGTQESLSEVNPRSIH